MTDLNAKDFHALITISDDGSCTYSLLLGDEETLIMLAQGVNDNLDQTLAVIKGDIERTL